MLDLPLDNPDIRTCAELLSVLADPGCACDGPVYEMYRDVAKHEADRKWLSSHQIRYDVTRIPGRVICGEWVKTKGHYHPTSPDGIAYPEIYEVLEGEARYLIQMRDLTDIVLVHAKKGDLVLIPPGYGHVTINPSKDTLMMANLVSSAFSSEYVPYEKMRGAPYYLFADGRIEKNSLYSADIPALRHVNGVGEDLPHVFPDKSLYDLIGDAEKLAFLNKPGKYSEEYKKLYLFQ